MNNLASPALRTFWGLLLLALLAGGCRTYGGYGTEPALLVQIERANTRFAEDLERARGDLATLHRAAASNAVLQPFAERYSAVVEVQEALLETHRTLGAEAADHPGSYRALSRIYGALISDQQIVRDRYEGLLEEIGSALGAPTPPAVEVQSRYYVAPQFYQRLEQTRARRSLTQILSTAPAALPAPATEAGAGAG